MNNCNKLDDENWFQLKSNGINSKESLLNKIIKNEYGKLCKEFTFCYNGEEQLFTVYKNHIKCKLGNTPNHTYAWYDHKNTITLNKEYFSQHKADNGYKAYYLLMHELRHCCQIQLLKTKKFYLLICKDM